MAHNVQDALTIDPGIRLKLQGVIKLLLRDKLEFVRQNSVLLAEKLLMNEDLARVIEVDTALTVRKQAVNSIELDAHGLETLCKSILDKEELVRAATCRRLLEVEHFKLNVELVRVVLCVMVRDRSTLVRNLCVELAKK